MKWDLRQTPFSRRGSYLAFSVRGDDSFPEGLYLRSIRCAAVKQEIFALWPVLEGKTVEYDMEPTPWELRLKTAYGNVEVCFGDEETILVRSSVPGLGIRLTQVCESSPFCYAHPVANGDDTRVVLNCFINGCRMLLETFEGRLRVLQSWKATKAESCDVEIDSGEQGFFFALRGAPKDLPLCLPSYDFNACREKVRLDFEDFAAKMPRAPERYADTRMFMSYVNWSGYVRPSGLFARNAMLMSKNWMTNVWSWDHCFNAMALASKLPEAAWDQWMILFDQQLPSGVLPDSVNDGATSWNFVKPPVHGWALRYMMGRMALTQSQRETALRVLTKWTEWWLQNRDGDGDGICEYYHGNDSGWDNSTAFAVLPPVETPDLSAFLVIQMDVMAGLAGDLGKSDEAVLWKKRADELMEKLLAHCFAGGIPVIRRSGTHEIVPCRSLIRYLPLVLGKRLPEEIRQATIRDLKAGGFYTSWGFATEAPDSPEYVPDGYWRGPIWAPSTMILLDGLRQCGEEAWADEAAERFCRLSQKSGAAENFDAISGEGLRDRAYTWTSSVFLMLAEQIADKEEI